MGVFDPSPVATVTAALADLGEGPLAASRADATAALRPGIGVPSDATADASSAACRNT